MTCKHCGAPFIEGEKFCRSCGNPLPVIEKVEAETVSEPEPVKTMDDFEYSGYEEETKDTYQELYEDPYENFDMPTGGPALSIVSMVLGILSLICCCFTGLAMTLSIGAVVCGIIAIVKRKSGKGMAIAGVITGGLGLVSALIMIICASASILNEVPIPEVEEFLENFEL